MYLVPKWGGGGGGVRSWIKYFFRGNFFTAGNVDNSIYCDRFSNNH
jgi:hypothetical protein